MENVSSMELFHRTDNTYLKALYDVNLTIPVGECHGIVGINSFELELLAEIIGNVKPHESGRCSLLEIGMMRQKRRILPHVYYINDQRVLYDHMHVLGYLMFASEHAPGKPEAKQAQWLKLLLKTGLYPFALTYIRSLNPAEYALVSALLAYASAAKLVVMDLQPHFRAGKPDRAVLLAHAGAYRRGQNGRSDKHLLRADPARLYARFLFNRWQHPAERLRRSALPGV